MGELSWSTKVKGIVLPLNYRCSF